MGETFEQWIEELLQAGKDLNYFPETAYLDTANKKIMIGGEDDGLFMTFADWSIFFDEGFTPHDAIVEDLSNA